jgi:hypothetical protein
MPVLLFIARPGLEFLSRGLHEEVARNQLMHDIDDMTVKL